MHDQTNPCGRCCWPDQCAAGCEKLRGYIAEIVDDLEWHWKIAVPDEARRHVINRVLSIMAAEEKIATFAAEAREDVYRRALRSVVPAGFDIDHLDGDIRNNAPENLRLVKIKENQR